MGRAPLAWEQLTMALTPDTLRVTGGSEPRTLRCIWINRSQRCSGKPDILNSTSQ